MLLPSTGELKAGLENLAPQLLAEFRHNGERDEVVPSKYWQLEDQHESTFRERLARSGRNPGLERARQTNPVQMIGRPGKLCTAPQRQSRAASIRCNQSRTEKRHLLYITGRGHIVFLILFKFLFDPCVIKYFLILIKFFDPGPLIYPCVSLSIHRFNYLLPDLPSTMFMVGRRSSQKKPMLVCQSFQDRSSTQ